MNQTLNQTLLDALRNRITGVFPAQIRAAVAPLNDEQLWWRPDERANSIANLILHLTGSLNYFLNRNLGDLAYDRNRAAEFAARTTMSKEELLAHFDAMVEEAARTFARLTPERLEAPSPEPAMSTIVVEDLINITAHLAAHAGQIVWISKMLAAGALDEIWIATHRDEGAWKKR